MAETPAATASGARPNALADGARIDELIARTQRFVVATLSDTVKQPISDVGVWMARRLLHFALALVLLAGAVGFFLVGTVLMLAQWIPLYGACLAVALVALTLGAVFLRVSRA